MKQTARDTVFSPQTEADRLAALQRLNLLDTPLEERFERITRMVCKTLDVPIAIFNLLDEKRQWFKSIQGMNGTENSRDLSFCIHTIATDSGLLVVPNTHNDDRFSQNPLVTGDPHINFYAGCAVHSPDGARVGTLCAADNKPRSLSPEQEQVLRDLTYMLENELRTSVMSNAYAAMAKDLDAAHRLALVDPLTRLWNRAGIDKIIKAEWADAAREHKPVALIVADIDHFKSINDTYGHPIGDVILQKVAKRLLKALRAGDAIGRTGGEEFLLLLPGVPALCEETADRLRRAIESKPFNTPAGPIPVTISLGLSIAQPDRKDHTIQAITKRADDALYAAKKAGRNCVKTDNAG